MEVTTIGIDIAKRIFQLHGVNKNGKTILKKKLMRDQVLIFMSNLPKGAVKLIKWEGICNILMEFRQFHFSDYMHLHCSPKGHRFPV